MSNASSATSEMRKLRDQFVKRLMANPDYRALIALDKAIAEVEGAPGQPEALVDIQSERRARQFEFHAIGSEHRSTPSHVNATIAVLDRVGHPMPLVALLPLVRDEGAVIKGKDPEINLSSSLSRSNHLRSVRYDGRTCWWLRDRPYPGEKDFGGPTGAATPAANKHENDGAQYAPA